jgi:hypothetical protein
MSSDSGSSMIDCMVQNYIERGPPYLGDSHFKDKEIIKNNGGRWDANSKKWTAKSLEVLRTLIETRKWFPFGIGCESAYGASVVVNKLYEMKSDICSTFKLSRRNSNNNTFDKKRDCEVICNKEYIYARLCNACGILLDSRLQFGLECDCELEFNWNSCNRCFIPVRNNDSCFCILSHNGLNNFNV